MQARQAGEVVLEKKIARDLTDAMHMALEKGLVSVVLGGVSCPNVYIIGHIRAWMMGHISGLASSFCVV